MSFYIYIYCQNTEIQMIEIGNKIKKTLTEKKISINTLAEEIGYTRQGLSTILKTGDFKVSVLQKISDVLDVDVCEFFHDPNKRKLEEELKSFIIAATFPYYHRDSIQFTEDGKKIKGDDFLYTSLKNIHIDYLFRDTLKHLDKKNNTDIKIFNYYRHGLGVNIDYLEKKELKGIGWERFPTFEEILQFFYKSINQDDINCAKKQITKNRKDFLLFLQNSSFVEWYKKNFNISELDIQSKLMDISSECHILYGDD